MKNAIVFAVLLVGLAFAGKNDTIYLNYRNGKITICHDSILSVETWKQKTDTTKTEYYQNTNNGEFRGGFRGGFIMDTNTKLYRNNFLQRPRRTEAGVGLQYDMLLQWEAEGGKEKMTTHIPIHSNPADLNENR